MHQTNRPLIVGAGPVGLGAALFLAMQGRDTRVIEMRGEPSQHSKALAVNPRTLDLLEPSGLSRQILELGSPIRGARFHRRGRVIAALSFVGIHPRYPFLVALSQASMERLLAQALEAAGGAIERGVRMVECRNVADGVQVFHEPSAGGPVETAVCPWLLAADGAHSVARQQLGIDFPGTSFAREWYLADAPLRTTLDEDHAHVFFADGGEFQFLIRVIDDALKDQPGDPVWRIIGNRAEPLGRLIEAEQTGPPVWTSSFRVSHRINAYLTAGAVYFAGDAGHIHSPIGARGMNLGLEDAWVFAQLAEAGELAKYNDLRRPIDRQVVRRVEFLSRIASGESSFYRFVRAFMLPRAVRIPFVRDRMLATLAGLDHELPNLAPRADSEGTDFSDESPINARRKRRAEQREKPMSDLPKNTRATVIPCLRYRDAPAAIEWLCGTFGFQKQLVVPNDDGSIAHAQLSFGNGMIMLGSALDTEFGRLMRQPDEIGGAETQCAYVVVSDADVVYERAKTAGAEIVMEIKDEDYGGRGFSCRDPEGHLWNFGTYDPW